MVVELKKSIELGRIFFGVKQTLKNSKNLNRVKVPLDCRREIVDILEKNGIEIEQMDLTKHDLANKLELDFQCEVFGLKK